MVPICGLHTHIHTTCTDWFTGSTTPAVPVVTATAPAVCHTCGFALPAWLVTLPPMRGLRIVRSPLRQRTPQLPHSHTPLLPVARIWGSKLPTVPGSFTPVDSADDHHHVLRRRTVLFWIIRTFLSTTLYRIFSTFLHLAFPVLPRAILYLFLVFRIQLPAHHWTAFAHHLPALGLLTVDSVPLATDTLISFG